MICLYSSDLMKSEERQRLAKERREEKAKYLGEWQKAGHYTNCAPPTGRGLFCVSARVSIWDGCSLHAAADGSDLLHIQERTQLSCVCVCMLKMLFTVTVPTSASRSWLLLLLVLHRKAVKPEEFSAACAENWAALFLTWLFLGTKSNYCLCSKRF